ncbi:serine protease [Blastopirellula sp. JC732]|uniref:Serine protease n=1 Tax=Blastopirellula sediminis TaxID=2894196 RepID=A0A9X1MMR7_9BACT|nr:trypsin-like peptidase domain-containing protein [Blastopirellula sediminis]MCC9606684.1 serine protease [Blastopirellula sediminis]MCC9630018.1 serine protease [Blastopirellula sediminis]
MFVRLTAVGLLAMAGIFGSGESLSAEERPARWESVVVIKSTVEKEGKTSVRSSTGFFVKQGEQVYLATARHSADESNPSSEILFSLGDNSVSLKLEELGQSVENSWLTKPSYDIAILPVSHKLLAKAACLELDDCRRQLPPPKTQLEVVGFPLALGLFGPDLSPVVMEAKLASGEISDPFKSDGQRIAIAIPAIAEGTSGAPVFALEGENDWRVIGVFIGILADSTGGKLSKLAPAHALIDLIEIDAAASK